MKHVLELDDFELSIVAPMLMLLLTSASPSSARLTLRQNDGFQVDRLSTMNAARGSHAPSASTHASFIGFPTLREAVIAPMRAFVAHANIPPRPNVAVQLDDSLN